MYTKKDHITVQSFNQRSFSKNYRVIGSGNGVKQVEPLRDTMEEEEEEEEEDREREREREEKKRKGKENEKEL